MRTGADDGAPVPADLVRRAQPRLGRTRLVCVDGPAGSGKTTVADLLVAELTRRGTSVALVHMDDVFEGWGGLADAGRRVRTQIVEPLAAGHAGAYSRYDWHQDRFAEQVEVPVVDLLVVEGVGSADVGYGQLIGVLVWIWAPEELRLQRGLERDGAAMADRWRQWMLEEQRLHADARTAERADVVVDGRSGDLTVT